MESRGEKVNMQTLEVIISGKSQKEVQNTALCSVCGTGDGRNLIQ